MISADRSAYPRPAQQTTQARARRGRRATYDPINQTEERLAHIVWERARAISQILAPDEPVGEEPLTEHESWLILETVAASLSPAYWEDPNALTDLYQLRKMFVPEAADPGLRDRAEYVRKTKEMLPDPAITPENPEFERRLRRLTR